MPFNLYFAGWTGPKIADVLMQSGCLRLLSYWHEKTGIKYVMSQGGKLFVDSGAYTAHTKGIEPDIDDYINYINERDELITVFAELDKIPGEFGKPKTAQQLAEAPEISWSNYLYIRERVKSPDKCLPIFHQGEDFKYLEQMLETTFEGKHIPYIGISPANDQPVKSKETWIKEVFKIIKNSKNPDVKTHAFGMTSLNLLEKYPFYSADSTTWVFGSKSGSILTSFGPLQISERGYFNKDYIDNQPIEVQDELKSMITEAGFTLEDLKTDYKARWKWNIKYLKKWADNYKYKPDSMKQKKLF